MDSMNWFEKITGFRETGYDETRKRLAVNGEWLSSLENGCRYHIGELELISLRELRERVLRDAPLNGRMRVRNVTGDVGHMHELPEYNGAVFQVASQFNLLEMTSPAVTPEEGVTHYEYDRTQGPACAVAAGAATIYRNYFVPVAGSIGQTSNRQLDGLADLGNELARRLGGPTTKLWTMRNGYALCHAEGLRRINQHIQSFDTDENDKLRELLRIGWHRDVEVTRSDDLQRPHVSQVFCSALPVAYVSGVPSHLWQPFAQLVLEAAYEATLWAAVLNARRGKSRTVLLTRLGGGAFGNADDWIDAAMSRALEKASAFDLHVDIVSYRDVPASMEKLAAAFTRQSSPHE